MNRNFLIEMHVLVLFCIPQAENALPDLCSLYLDHSVLNMASIFCNSGHVYLSCNVSHNIALQYKTKNGLDTLSIVKLPGEREHPLHVVIVLL